MGAKPPITTEEAVRQLRADPRHAALVRDTYLDLDVVAAAARFRESGEWKAAAELLVPVIRGGTAVDLGSGNGMAAAAMVCAGAARVVAIEPDPSAEIGRGAIAVVCAGLPVEVLAAFAECLPLSDESADCVYARQVLHHTQDLNLALRECARVLRRSGLFLACREHVADNNEELAVFLHEHPVHQLTGGEHAYKLQEYRAAITGAGLRIVREIGPWDSVINLFPSVNSDDEIPGIPDRVIVEKFGALGRAMAPIPGVRQLVAARLRRPRPGRLCTFLAKKP
jgi:ubiquinone/menaquinone biosynthesis C-methylase UbiE